MDLRVFGAVILSTVSPTSQARLGPTALRVQALGLGKRLIESRKSRPPEERAQIIWNLPESGTTTPCRFENPTQALNPKPCTATPTAYLVQDTFICCLD